MEAVKYDAIVIGSGPNGLAAAITLARAGRSVLVRESAPIVGGGARTEALTLPGFLHDTFSACHPLGAGSPFFRTLGLENHGLQWIEGAAAVAHPLDHEPAALLFRSPEKTAEGLGEDGENYLRLMKPLLAQGEALLAEILRPVWHLPRHPLLLSRFGWSALRSAEALIGARFRAPRARALFAGIAAHASLPLDWPGSAAPGLVLALAGHVAGWPIPRGGAGEIGRALAAELRAHGGEIELASPVEDLGALPEHRLLFFDLTPRQILRLAGTRLPKSYARRLRAFRYGPGVFKMDWALAGPIPWRDSQTALSPTVHLGGTAEELFRSEAAPVAGRVPHSPYVLLVQPSLFDPSRAPPGQHTVWAYCHVPHGSRESVAEKLEAQIERFAPGFSARILARNILAPADLENRNPNLIGGDIGGGLSHLKQLLVRPTLSAYRMPVRGWFLCSSSTPPGPGVHGMCGHLSARAALASLE